MKFTKRRLLDELRTLLTADMTRFQRQLHRRLLDDLCAQFHKYCGEIEASERRAAKNVPRHVRHKWWNDLQQDRRRPENSVFRRFIDCLRDGIRNQFVELEELADRHREFGKDIAQALSDEESQRIILEHAAQLDPGRWRAWRDARACRRWFTAEAIHDRYERRRGETEQRLAFSLDRLGIIMRHLTSLMQGIDQTTDLWNRLGIMGVIDEALRYPGDVRVARGALRGLQQALQGLRVDDAAVVVSPSVDMILQQMAQDSSLDVWLQTGAIDILHRIAPDLCVATLRLRLLQPRAGDDLFVRRHCLRVMEHYWLQVWADDVLFAHIGSDPSDAVRQQLAKSVWSAPETLLQRILTPLLQEDSCPAVRAMGLVRALDYVARAEVYGWFLPLLTHTLQHESDVFVQRTAIWVASEWLVRWSERSPSYSEEIVEQVRHAYRRDIEPALRALQQSAASIAVRRWAAAAAERIWVVTNPRANALYQQLAQFAMTVRPGQSRRVPQALRRNVDLDDLGRVMAVLVECDFGIELETGHWGWRMSRPPQFGWRLWRIWHEFLRPATDKRQAFQHTIGRVSRASVRAPSRVMGELSQTKVPGEPLVIADDGTWRPFVPLLDDVISTLNQSWLQPRPAKVYTCEGVTEIIPPPALKQRLRAGIKLVREFAQVAELRNWQSHSTRRPEKYVESLREMGFDVKFRPHAHANDRPPVDPSVTQFFAVLPAMSLPELGSCAWEYFHDYSYYFTSSFENSLNHLVAFAAMGLGAFALRHAYVNRQIARARRSLPISIGGWGTRGKSGTERLKAALLTGQGHGIVSKTTGCEAMFIQGFAHGRPLEIPLYRPNDKATIWEHGTMIRFAAAMRPSAFLWECMGLTPSYVDVLQRQWTRDDLATITNTYPDHEDLQGPAGYNVATTITGFVPYRSHLITTEYQMRPLIREACARMGTSLRGVGWLESGLITNDILERFPYREHPDNIALVAAMADELGIDADFALQAMADFLIPDLGVLKTHPTATAQTRRIEFSNGMSANERFGCMGNWQRLNFHQHDPNAQPDVWLSTVVNNRADRVARSRVFADVVVNDLSADRHFLIGGNLKGLMGFINEAWDDYARRVSLVKEGTSWSTTQADAILTSLASRFRVPTTTEAIRQQILPMLQAALPATEGSLLVDWSKRWSETDDEEALRSTLATASCPERLRQAIESHVRNLRTAWREYCELRDAIGQVRDESSVAALDERVRTTLREWFQRKIVVIENYYATGNEVIQTIVDATPPGYLNRVMGIQNIKGTGLDFVYRFHAWDTCHQACQLLMNRDHESRQKGIQLLNTMTDFGVLCHDTIRRTLQQLHEATPPATADQQLQLDAINARLEEASADRGSKNAASSRSTSRWHQWWQAGVGLFEQWFEIHDAVRRRCDADQIYRDLQYGRIGRLRAVEELRKLNKRQKGGWLLHQLAGDDDDHSA